MSQSRIHHLNSFSRTLREGKMSGRATQKIGHAPSKEHTSLLERIQSFCPFEKVDEMCGFCHPYMKFDTNFPDSGNFDASIVPYSCPDDETVITSNVTVVNQSEKNYARSKFSATKERELRQLRTERNRFRKQTQQLKEKLAKIRAPGRPEKTEDQNLLSHVQMLLNSIVNYDKTSKEFVAASALIDTRPDFCLETEDASRAVRHVVKIMMATKYSCNMATVEEFLSNRRSEKAKEYEAIFLTIPVLRNVKITAYPGLLDRFKLDGYYQQTLEETICPVSQPSQEAKMICFFSKAALLCLDIINAGTWNAILVAVARSIVYTSTAPLIDKVLGGASSLQDFVRKRLLPYSPVENQNVVEDVRDMIRMGVGLNEKIKEIPLLSLIDEVMCLSVFFWFGEDIPDSDLYRNILDRNTKAHKNDSLSLVSRLSSVADTALMILSTLGTGIDYSSIVNPLDIELRLGKLLGYYKAYESGNLDVLDPEETSYTVEKYEREVIKLADDIRILVEKRAVKPAAMPTFTRFLGTAGEMKAKILIKRKARIEKDAPYFVGIYGKAGVGKTSAIERVKAAVAIAFNREIRHEHVWAGSDDPNGWDTGADSSKLFLSIMEHDNIKKKDATAQTFFNIANLADTVPSAFNKPDLETKSYCFNFLLGGAICCNQQDFGIIKNVSSAGAVKRRVDFFEMSVQSQYGTMDESKGEKHLRPDTSKIPIVEYEDGTRMPFQNIHWIQEYTFVETEVANDKTGVSRSTEIKKIGEKMNDSQWSALMVRRARTKIAESKLYNETIDAHRRMDHCKTCSNVKRYCSCEAGFVSCIPVPPEKIPYTTMIREFCLDAKKLAVSFFSTNKTLIDISKDDLVLRALETTHNQNNEDYGFYGQIYEHSSSFLISLGSTTSFGIYSILAYFGRGLTCSALHSFFNLRTSAMAAAPFFIWNPIAAATIFSTMYILSCSVHYVAEAAITVSTVRNLSRGVTNRYWSTAFISVSVVAALATGFYMFNAEKSDSGIEDDELSDVTEVVNDSGIDPVSFEEVKNRQKNPTEWLVRAPIDIETPREVRTATQEQVINVVNANTAVIKYGGRQIKCLFITSCVLLVPIHDTELYEGCTVPIHRANTGGIKEAQIVDILRIRSDGLETDMCVVTINVRFLVRNILQFFDVPDSFYELGKKIGGCCLYASETHKTSPYVAMVRTETRFFRGLAVPIQNTTKSGDCGSVVIRNECPCVIVGMHVSVSGGERSNCVIVTKSMIMKLLNQSTLDQNVIYHDNVFMDNCLPNSPRITNGKASERVATRFLRLVGEECTATPPSVTVLGHDTQTRITKKSEVELTPMSGALEKHGIPRLHGPPPLNANRAFAIALQHGARGARARSFHVSEAIKKHYAVKISDAMNKRGMKVAIMTYHDALHGIFDNRYAKPTALNKANGGGVPGKKKSRVFDTFNFDTEIPGYELDDEISLTSRCVDILPDFLDDEGSHCAVVNGSHPSDVVEMKPRIKDDVRLGVQKIFAELNSGKSMNSAVWAALKDDPTLLRKIDEGKGFGRLVTSVTFEMHVFDTMILGEILAHLRTIPLITGCYEGISFLSEDFNDIAYHHMDFFVEPNFIDGDTTKMDLSMSEQEIRDCFDCLSLICEGAGCGKEQASLIRARGRDLSLPVMNIFGEWVSFPMNTSGNKATITINNIAGVQMRTREAWIAMKLALDLFGRVVLTPEEFREVHLEMDDLMEDEADILLWDFDGNVRVGSVGDDSLISTISGTFTMDFICTYFKSKGVNITGSSKTSEISARQRLKDLSCCQRSFRWSEELSRIVGPLSLVSLSRSLHCRLPSGADSDLVEQDVVTTVKEELWFHGEEVYNEWTRMIDAAIMSTERKGLHEESYGKTYEEMGVVMMARFPTSEYNLERSDRIKSLFLEPGNSYEGLTNQQITSARVVVHEHRLPLGASTSARGHVHDQSGFCSDLDPGPKHTNIRISNTKQENTTGSEVVHNINFQIPESAESGFMYPSAKPSRVAQSHDTISGMTERPIKIMTLSWNVNEKVNASFDPWEIMLTDELIQRRFDYFRFFRGKLRIKAMIDGTPFHAGLVWITYIPLWSSDEMSGEVTSEADLVEASQRPRITINPRDSQGGEMVLPFIYTEDYVDLTDSSARNLGRIFVHTVSPLLMVNNETRPVIITILGFFEDVELSTPTNHRSVLTKTLNTVDQNLIEAESTMETSTSRNLAPENREMLRTDPAIMMASSRETSISKIGSRESFIGQFVWDANDGPDTVICSSRCSPFHGIRMGSGVDAVYHVIPSAWVGLPFEYWRGTCRFRVEVVCASMHKGKLMFSWDPKFTKTSGDYNRNYITVMDVGQTTEHHATTGWGCSLPYLPTISGMSQMDNCSSVEYKGSVDYASGVFTVSVLSPLVVPADSARKNVTINMYASMCDDFELVLPRKPLAFPLLNNYPDVRDFPDQTSVSATTSTVTPALSAIRTLVLCEVPALLLIKPNLGFEGSEQFINVSLPSESSDLDMNRVKVGDGKFVLAPNMPKTEQHAVAFRTRGFVQGTTVVVITGQKFPGPDSTKMETLTGISDEKVLEFPPSDVGNEYTGSFYFNSTNQIQIVRTLYHLPAWALVRLRPSPVTDPTHGVINPYVFFENFDGSSIASGSIAGINGRRIGFYLPPAYPVLFSNFVLTYTLTSGPGECFAADTLNVNMDQQLERLAPTNPGEIRHAALTWSKNMRVHITGGRQLTLLGITYLVPNETSTRTAVRNLPVTNQNLVEETVTSYGPPLPTGVDHDFFQGVVRDIMEPLHIPSTFMEFRITDPGSVVLNPMRGIVIFKIMHFPIRTREAINGTNISEHVLVPTLFEYFSRGYVGMRGSMKVIVRSCGRFTNFSLAWGRATRCDSDLILTSALNSSALSEPTPAAGCEFFNMRYNYEARLTIPWYHRKRFALCRSTARSDHNKYAVKFIGGGTFGEKVSVDYAVGSDFSIGHFLSTPPLVVK